MTKEEAIRMADSGWWIELPIEEAARFQLFEPRLCMPFSDFHGGVEKLLKRPVFTHEFAFSDKPGGLREEALGIAPMRSFDDILRLLPEDKRIVVLGGGR